jgi:NAD(P)-dependent dehydrogenase (short-subunit alcohol dehydrogenase family)
MARLSEKRAVITGASSGMGLGIARALLEQGAEVVLTGTDEGRLQDAVRGLGPRAHAVRSDVASLADIARLRSLIQERFGALDAVFLNAGFCKLRPFHEVSEAEFDQTFAVNTKGAFFTSQQLAPLVRDGGAFVFTTSVANVVGYPGMSAYSGAKAAVRSLAQVLAAELLPRRIRVNCLSPGFVKTPTMGLSGASRAELDGFEAEGSRLTPMGRMSSVDEVARAALFLAFDATFTTGTELLIDGGLTELVAPSQHG